MSAIASIFKASCFLLASAGIALAEAPSTAPKRVVSVNLCTDQMAMLLAPPSQLVSISFLALEPQVSAMTEEAKAYSINHAQLEEIVSLKPDLVLAHEWTSPLLLERLQRFGIPFEIFSTPTELSAIPDFIRQMGGVLGRDAEAIALINQYQARLQKLEARRKDDTPMSLVSYGPNGWVSGAQNLGADGLKFAGFDLIAEDYGLEFGGFMPLEVLLKAHPDIILTDSLYPGTSRSEEILVHPALAKSGAEILELEGTEAWGCGLPRSLDAVEELMSFKERRSL